MHAVCYLVVRKHCRHAFTLPNCFNNLSVLILLYRCADYEAKRHSFFVPEQDQSVDDLSNNQEICVSHDIAISVNPGSTPLKKKVLTDEKVIKLEYQLLELMRKDKPYLDSEITLPKLSKMMLSNTYHMSYLLNECLEENFYTFINRYRIEECMRLFNDPAYDHFTILGIAFECGFNSKTSFNVFFKKITGLSPREYREQCNKKNALEVSSSLSNN